MAQAPQQAIDLNMKFVDYFKMPGSDDPKAKLVATLYRLGVKLENKMIDLPKLKDDKGKNLGLTEKNLKAKLIAAANAKNPEKIDLPVASIDKLLNHYQKMKAQLLGTELGKAGFKV